MKKILSTALAALLVSLAPAAFAGSFGAEKAVTDGTTPAQFPNVAYYNGVIHIVFVGYAPGSNGDIFYTRSTNNGSTFSAPLNLSAGNTEVEDRPQVTAGPNGVVVAWNSSQDNGAVYSRRSGDGGLNFAARVTVADSGGAFYSRVTGLLTDSGGRVHLAYYDNGFTGGASGQVRHRMSCDGGATYSTDTAVTSQAVDGDYDNEQPRITESGGRIFIVFRTSRLGDPQGGWPPYAISMQSGTVNAGPCTVTWSYPARRIAGGLPLDFNGSYNADIAGDATGNLLVTHWSMTSGANVYFRKGTATGLLGASNKLSGFNLDHLEPGGLSSTAAQTRGGFLAPPGLATNGSSAFITYQQQSGQTGEGYEFGQVYLRESPDNGSTWNPEVPISSAAKANTPRVALGGAGNQNLAIVYSDISDGSSRIMFRMYAAGPATGPSFSLTPSPQTFGAVTVGSNSTASITLVNTGLAGNINGVAFSGDFSLVSTTCGASLAASGSCSYTVRFTPTTLGTRNGTMTVSTNAPDSPSVAVLTGTGNPGTYSNNLSAIVSGYYETILQRSPDAAGRDYWIGEAGRVTSLGADVREMFFALAVQFFNTPEYLNRNTSNTQYLTDLYRTFFVREPDQAGMDYWMGFLNAGMDRGALLTNFLFSTEFSNKMTGLFGSPTIRPEINMVIDLYRGILGVLPDSAGFNFWLGQVRAAQCQGGDNVSTAVRTIADGFVNSAEYANREAARPAGMRNGFHIGDLYNAFLRRGADLAGYQYWVGQLNGGTPRGDVRLQYIQSPEFQNRVAQVIMAGCAN